MCKWGYELIHLLQELAMTMPTPNDIFWSPLHFRAPLHHKRLTTSRGYKNRPLRLFFSSLLSILPILCGYNVLRRPRCAE